MKKIILLFCCVMMLSATVFAQSAPIPLYPKGVPNSKKAPAAYAEKTDQNSWITLVTDPTITPYLPAKGTATGTAVIICPGGSYAGLASAHEGKAPAEAFAKQGIAAFVLKYRLPSDQIMVDKTIGPLQDAQRAIQLVREHAAEWGIDPKKVGILGFSAGGHLASTLTTHYSKAVIDNPNNTNLRPDFSLLLYPVITFGGFTHAGSKENLVGKNPSAELVELYSNEKQITSDTPPCFLVHAEDDNVVPVQNSIMFYDQLIAHKVKGEMHIYQAGGHGFGLNNPTTKDMWFDRAINFLHTNGF